MLRTIVLIDGSNFYFKLKSLGLIQQLKFNFSKFAKFLAGKKRLVRTTYYMGKVVEYIGFSHEKSIALVAECRETRLLKLEDIENFMRGEKKGTRIKKFV